MKEKRDGWNKRNREKRIVVGKDSRLICKMMEKKKRKIGICKKMVRKKFRICERKWMKKMREERIGNEKLLEKMRRMVFIKDRNESDEKGRENKKENIMSKKK